MFLVALGKKSLHFPPHRDQKFPTRTRTRLASICTSGLIFAPFFLLKKKQLITERTRDPMYKLHHTSSSTDFAQIRASTQNK